MGSALNYGPRIKCYKNNFELIITTYKVKIFFVGFKSMHEENLEILKQTISDTVNEITIEIVKQQSYKSKYDTYVPKLNTVLYRYEETIFII